MLYSLIQSLELFCLSNTQCSCLIPRTSPFPPRPEIMAICTRCLEIEAADKASRPPLPRPARGACDPLQATTAMSLDLYASTRKSAGFGIRTLLVSAYLVLSWNHTPSAALARESKVVQTSTIPQSVCIAGLVSCPALMSTRA